MNPKVSLLASFFLLLSYANAFNITQLLGQYPDFSTFNSYLTQTLVAGQINGRQTITVLVVENGAVSAISGKSADVLKKIMSVHVILDYYDVPKLQKLSNKTALLTTLFQTSGQAIGQQGFLNVTDLSTGSVVFGSAVTGSTLGANLVKSVASQPYNISVLQISNVIIPSGIDGSNTNSSSNSTTAPQVSPVPAASPSNSSTNAPSSPTPSTPPPSNATAPAPRPPQPSKAPTPSKATAPATAPTTSNATIPTPAIAPSTATIPTPAIAPSTATTTAPASPPSNATTTAPASAPSNATTPTADATAPTADAPSPAADATSSPPKPAGGPADGPAANAPAPTGDAPSAGLALRVSINVFTVIVLLPLSFVSMV